MYDDATALSAVRIIRAKSDAKQAIQEMVAEVQSDGGRRVKRLRMDNGVEDTAAVFQNWTLNSSIAIEFSPSESPESNGSAERLNRTLIDMARTTLAGTKHVPSANSSHKLEMPLLD